MLHDAFVQQLGFDVSRESFEKLEIYHRLLLKWQKAINLVSPRTLQIAWERHFLDSAQVSRYLPEGFVRITDWGSGGGFAGAVLAILNPDIEFTLVESDERKCQFLRTVSRETSVPIRIENARIENYVEGYIDAYKNNNVLSSIVVTARALASVETLLGYAAPLIDAEIDVQMLLLKGEAAKDEVQDALNAYMFDYELYPSLTEPNASIVHLSNISVR